MHSQSSITHRTNFFAVAFQLDSISKSVVFCLCLYLEYACVCLYVARITRQDNNNLYLHDKKTEALVQKEKQSQF